ncbi:hypothetical protein D3C76_971080 [compost metagenome]
MTLNKDRIGVNKKSTREPKNTMPNTKRIARQTLMKLFSLAIVSLPSSDLDVFQLVILESGW